MEIKHSYQNTQKMILYNYNSRIVNYASKKNIPMDLTTNRVFLLAIMEHRLAGRSKPNPKDRLVIRLDGPNW